MTPHDSVSKAVRVAVLLVAWGSLMPACSTRGDVPDDELGRAGVPTYPFGVTVGPFESFSSQRTRVFPFACGPVTAAQPQLLEDPLKRPGAYSLVTRGPQELYVLGGVAAPLVLSLAGLAMPPPYLARINTSAMDEVWKVELSSSPLPFQHQSSMALERGNTLLATFWNRILRLSGDDGSILQEGQLPTPEGSEVDNVSYTHLIILSDGNVVAKSMSRRSGCQQQGPLAFAAAFLNCGSELAPNSSLVLVDATSLRVLQEVGLGSFVGARHTSTVHEGLEYVYVVLPDGRLRRYLYTRTQLWLDSSWPGASILTPGVPSANGPTAAVPVNGWLVATTNSGPSPWPLTVTAVWQNDPSIVYQMQPFKDLSPHIDDTTFVSYSATQAAVDPHTNTVFMSDMIAGQMAAYNLTASGFHHLWNVTQFNLDFPVLMGPAGQRVLVAVNVSGIVGTPTPEAALTGAYPSQTLVFRHASNGSLVTQTAELEGIAGIVPHTPGFDGQFFYLGSQKETLVRVTYDSGTCKSEPAA